MNLTAHLALPILAFLGLCTSGHGPAAGQHESHEKYGSTAASIYYVSPSGDDDFPGTLTQPWRTLQHAADTVTAGATIAIRAGTYHERVVPQYSGSPGQYIAYTAYAGEVATIDGMGLAVPTDEGLFYVSGRSYIRISGLSISNSGYAGILIDNSSDIIIEGVHTYNTASSGIGVWGSSHLLVDGNEVELACSNGMQESLTIAGSDSFEVSRNHVHNGVAGYDKEGICIKDGSSNGKVHHNRVHHTETVGIYIDAWDKLTSNIDVFGNVVHDTGNTGFSLASESGGRLEKIHLYNNIAYRNKTVGIWLSGCCPHVVTHPMEDIWIVNNTLFDNGQGPWGGGIGLENPDVRNVLIRNNLLSQNLSFQIAIDAQIPTPTLTVDYNLIDGYRGGEGEIYGTAWVDGNPLFASAMAGDFQLLPGSPAIDAGTAAEAPVDDMRGTVRPQDGNHDGHAGFDLGAYEAALYTVRMHLPAILKP